MASRISVRPAARLGVAGVHAQQVAGEQRRLLAALPGLDLEQRVLAVGGVARAPAAGCSRSSAVARRRPAAPRPRRRRSASSAASSRGRLDVVAELPPVGARAVTIARQLGVALVERAWPARWSAWIAGSASRRSSSACSATQCLDGLEHRALLRWARWLRRAPDRRRTPAPRTARPASEQATWRRRRLLGCGLLGVAGLEAGDAAAGVEDLLLAGVERVAVRAHVGVDRAARRRCCGW